MIKSTDRIRRTGKLIASLLAVLVLVFGVSPVYAENNVTLTIKNEEADAGTNLKKEKALIAQSLAKHIPGDMIQYFTTHHGVIYIGTWNGAGYTMLAVGADNKPMIPDEVFKDYPMEMHISTQDAAIGYMDDYVLHEFGHVFDARYGITRNPAYDAYVAMELPAIYMAMQGVTTDDTHYTTTPEAFAQVYAAYRGGDDVVGGRAVLQAAPYTVGIIKAFEGADS